MQHVVAVVRHNTQLGGDLQLACREFDALMGMRGEDVKDRKALADLLGNSRVAAAVALSPNDSVVARLYHNAQVKDVEHLLRRGAFVQEVFVEDDDDRKLSGSSRSARYLAFSAVTYRGGVS